MKYISKASNWINNMVILIYNYFLCSCFILINLFTNSITCRWQLRSLCWLFFALITIHFCTNITSAIADWLGFYVFTLLPVLPTVSSAPITPLGKTFLAGFDKRYCQLGWNAPLGFCGRSLPAAEAGRPHLWFFYSMPTQQLRNHFGASFSVSPEEVYHQYRVVVSTSTWTHMYSLSLLLYFLRETSAIPLHTLPNVSTCFLL